MYQGCTAEVYRCTSKDEQTKGALYGLRELLASERPLKKMKNAFYFTLKALFLFKIFKFLS